MERWPRNYNKLSQHTKAKKRYKSKLTLFAKVSEARKNTIFQIFFVVVKDSLVYESGEIGTFLFHSQYGNMLNGVEMAAYVYGKLQAEQRERINTLMTGKD